MSPGGAVLADETRFGVPSTGAPESASPSPWSWIVTIYCTGPGEPSPSLCTVSARNGRRLLCASNATAGTSLPPEPAPSAASGRGIHAGHLVRHPRSGASSPDGHPDRPLGQSRSSRPHTQPPRPRYSSAQHTVFKPANLSGFHAAANTSVIRSCSPGGSTARSRSCRRILTRGCWCTTMGVRTRARCAVENANGEVRRRQTNLPGEDYRVT